MRRHLTLLEVVVVMALIGLIGGTLGVRIVRDNRSERFRQGVEAVSAQLHLAQQLMVARHAEVTLRFTSAEPGLLLTLEQEGALRHPLQLKTLTEVEPDEIHLNPHRALDGSLTLSNGEQRQTLYLRGYPAPVSDRPPPPLSDTPYPEAFLSAAGGGDRAESDLAADGAAPPPPPEDEGGAAQGDGGGEAALSDESGAGGGAPSSADS